MRETGARGSAPELATQAAAGLSIALFASLTQASDPDSADGTRTATLAPPLAIEAAARLPPAGAEPTAANAALVTEEAALSTEEAALVTDVAAHPPEDAAPSAGELEQGMDEVVVRAARRAPGSFHAVSQRNIERYRYDDPHQLLSLVPGVYVRQEDGFGLRPNIGIRGATSDRSKKVALMEDGVLLAPAPYSAPAAYYFPLLARAYQLRVIKGPASIAYGPQTIGGAVEILTRPLPFAPSGALDLAVGTYGNAKLHARYGSGDIDGGFAIEGVHLRSDGFKELPGGADTGFYRNEWTFKAQRVLSPRSETPQEILLKVTYSDEASNETYLGLSDEDFRRAPLSRYAASALDRMEWHRTSVVLTHRVEPVPSLTLTTAAYRHDLARTWRKFNGLRGAQVSEVLRAPDTPQNAIFQGVLAGVVDGTSSAEAVLVGPNERDFVSQGMQTTVKWQALTGPLAHQIEYGLRLHHDRVERRHSEDAFRMSGGRLVPEGSPTVVTSYNEADTVALALHASDAIEWAGLTLTPGVRVELIHSTYADAIASERGEASMGVLLPGVGIHHAFTEELGVLAGVHRGMSPPPPGARGGSPELSWNYEAGARYTAQSSRLELIAYYNDYRNLADVCSYSSGCSEQDIDVQFGAGRARIYGVEAAVDHVFAFEPLEVPVSVSYTLTESEFLETFRSEDPIFGNVRAGDEMPYVPRHQGRGSVALEHSSFGGYVAGTLISAMREQPGRGPGGLRTDRQLTFDVGAHYRLDHPSATRIYLQVRNLFDERFIASRRPFGARPNAPRFIHVGAQLEF